MAAALLQRGLPHSIQWLPPRLVLLLLGGGSKKRQQKDIDEAVALWEDYKRRKVQLKKGT